MRKLLALCVVAGSGVMAYAWWPTRDVDRELAWINDVSPTGNARISAPADSGASVNGQRTFSPRAPLVASPAPAPAAKSAQSAVVPPAPVPASRGFETVVIKSPAATARDNGMSRPDLVRSLQRELRRVGCYKGDLTGDWGPATRSALAAFMERANASLPTGEPDPILLRLVQGYTSPLCGHACPAGQKSNDSGHCVPTAVMAHTNRKPAVPAGFAEVHAAKPGAAWPATTHPAGRSTIASPAPAPSVAPAPAAAPSTVVATRPGVDLPGRMAVGGPGLPTAPVTAAPSPADGAAAAGLASAEDDMAAVAMPPPAAKPKPRTEPQRVQRSRDTGWMTRAFSNGG